MIARPKFQLSRLREIGWAKWDPIGVGGPEYGWPADEYDSYLLNAAGQLWNGKSVEDVANYLFEIETKDMGLEAISGSRPQALDVARAMREYVETLRR